ncbi:flagellar assembly protein FliH [Thaumasiovibrio subtropicus]|uniref:flagellar assembly protein FliH n=1 Tax=Thaumasiovibrio subtropicus TaxID=1891207 RepID=UPI000B357420|nr:flagellar assembly protein FliH [Thaumasiovibrio subtropicus]
MAFDRRRGYIRVTEEQNPELAKWDLPDYGEVDELPRETALNYDPNWQAPEPEPEEQEEMPAPLTAADLDTIRQSAYDEGFADGQAKGYQAGFEAGEPEGHAKGLETGQAEGLEKGLEEGQATITAQAEQLVTLADKLAAPMAQVDEQVEKEMVNLVMQLASELFQVELQTNPQIILKTLREAIASLPIAGRKTSLQLHPEDLALVEEAYGKANLEGRNWVLIAEPALQRGDVVVQAQDSQVDYLMANRVKELLHNFLGHNGMGQDAV